MKNLNFGCFSHFFHRPNFILYSQTANWTNLINNLSNISFSIANPRPIELISIQRRERVDIEIVWYWWETGRCREWKKRFEMEKRCSGLFSKIPWLFYKERSGQVYYLACKGQVGCFDSRADSLINCADNSFSNHLTFHSDIQDKVFELNLMIIGMSSVKFTSSHIWNPNYLFPSLIFIIFKAIWYQTLLDCPYETKVVLLLVNVTGIRCHNNFTVEFPYFYANEVDMSYIFVRSMTTPSSGAYLNPFTNANLYGNPYSIDLSHQNQPDLYCFGENIPSNVVTDTVFLIHFLHSLCNSTYFIDRKFSEYNLKHLQYFCWSALLFRGTDPGTFCSNSLGINAYQERYTSWVRIDGIS